MPTEISTIMAALIGAVFGSLGGVYLTHLLAQRAVSNDRRRRIVQLYLLQLQDAVQSLWFRFDNLSNRQGRRVMENEYFVATTLYAWARVIAYSRILLLDGVYPQLKNNFKDSVLKSFEKVDAKLKDPAFQHYDRLALAEAVLVRDEGHTRTGTFLEFKTRYPNQESLSHWPFQRASEYIERLSDATVKEVLSALYEFAKLIKKETDIPLHEKLSGEA